MNASSRFDWSCEASIILARISCAAQRNDERLLARVRSIPAPASTFSVTTFGVAVPQALVATAVTKIRFLE